MENSLNFARASLLLLALLASACDGNPPAQAPPAQAPSEPEPTEPTFLSRIDLDGHPAVAAPVEPVLPRFDFSGDKLYAFDYHQRVIHRMDMSGFPDKTGGTTQRLKGAGLLLVKSKGDGTGTLLLKDMTLTMSMEMKDGRPDKTASMQSPTLAVPDVKEDGSMEGGASQAQPLLKLLFPMPPKALRAGESAEVPLRIPYNAMGSPLTAKGAATITLTGFVAIDGRPCARLESEIDVSQLDVPPELEGKHALSAKGKSVYYYDPTAREFVSGGIAVLMKLRSEGRMPKFTPPEGSKAPPMPETVTMSMFSDNLIRIARNPERAAQEAGRK